MIFNKEWFTYIWLDLTVILVVWPYSILLQKKIILPVMGCEIYLTLVWIYTITGVSNVYSVILKIIGNVLDANILITL